MGFDHKETLSILFNMPISLILSEYITSRHQLEVTRDLLFREDLL